MPERWWSKLNLRRVVGVEYQRLKYLGNGLNGVVFRALRRATREPVAIKFIRISAGDRTSRKRLRAEVEAMERLDGNGAVKLLGSDLRATPPFYVMEYLPLGDLRKSLARRSGAVKLLSVYKAVCECVSSCHAQGITHRDIKPENVLFRKPSAPVLGDFGICKVGGAILGTTVLEMKDRGTPLYMAPEQLRDHLTQSTEADVFALGTVLHFDIAERLKHPVVQKEAQELAEKCRATQPLKRAPLKDLIAGVDRLLEMATRNQAAPPHHLRLLDLVSAAIDRLQKQSLTLVDEEGGYLRRRMEEFNNLVDSSLRFHTSDHWYLEEVPSYYAPHFTQARMDEPPAVKQEILLKEARRFVAHIRRYKRYLH